MAYRIALIPGDGIGREVIPEGVRVLETLAGRFDFELDLEAFSYSCARYLEHGAMMPEHGIERLRTFDSIFLGAVGAPGVPDNVSLWGLPRATQAIPAAGPVELAIGRRSQPRHCSTARPKR